MNPFETAQTAAGTSSFTVTHFYPDLAGQTSVEQNAARPLPPRPRPQKRKRISRWDRGPVSSSSSAIPEQPPVHVLSEQQQMALQRIRVPVSGGKQGGAAVTILADPAGCLGYANDSESCAGRSGIGGNMLWGGARLLTAHLMGRPDIRAAIAGGAAVVEVGGGLGLVGMAAAKLGARSVTITDLPEVLPLLRHNIAANFPAVTATVPAAPAGGGRGNASGQPGEEGAVGLVRAMALDWTRCDAKAATAAWAFGSSRAEEPDGHTRAESWVVGADVLYDPQLVQPLAETVRMLCSHARSRCRVVLALSHESVSGVKHGLQNFEILDAELSCRGIVRDDADHDDDDADAADDAADTETACRASGRGDGEGFAPGVTIRHYRYTALSGG
eukprot:SAG22_NODE_5_length_41775_cov_111.520971_12_plen_387_part_00